MPFNPMKPIEQHLIRDIPVDPAVEFALHALHRSKDGNVPIHDCQPSNLVKCFAFAFERWNHKDGNIAIASPACTSSGESENGISVELAAHEETVLVRTSLTMRGRHQHQRLYPSRGVAAHNRVKVVQVNSVLMSDQKEAAGSSLRCRLRHTGDKATVGWHQLNQSRISRESEDELRG